MRRTKKNKKNQTRIIKKISDLKNIQKKDKLILGGVGMKKKIEIIKMAEEVKIKFENINIQKFLKKLNKKQNKNEIK
jgi:ribosomal protein L32E